MVYYIFVYTRHIFQGSPMALPSMALCYLTRGRGIKGQWWRVGLSLKVIDMVSSDQARGKLGLEAEAWKIFCL